MQILEKKKYKKLVLVCVSVYSSTLYDTLYDISMSANETMKEF